jgi:ferritin-like metal-binding protein YciE
VEHYESRCESLLTRVGEFGLKRAVRLLENTLKEEKNAYAALSKIAVDNVNKHTEAA